MSALAPRFQAILASAWISKREAAKYVQSYIKRVQSPEPTPFTPPIQVQVLSIAPSTKYESLDAINGGEDSLFHTRNKQNLTFGVADGVGGWNESGVDPSIFSRTLTAYLASVSETTFLLHDSDEIEPKEMLRKAFAGMRADQVPAYGSATSLVMNVSLASGNMRSAQLGDSTYVVMEGVGGQKQRVRFVSAEQQHRFNMPYQLTIPPVSEQPEESRPGDDNKESAMFYRPRVRDELMSETIDKDDFADLSLVGFDTPVDARVEEHQLNHGDLVLAATDGLFDNVRVDEIEKLTEKFMLAIVDRSRKSVKKQKENDGSLETDLFGGLAYSVAAQAVANYIQDDLRSPFAERAKLAGYNYSGGKPDDVTVMLAWIRDSARLEAEQKSANLSAKL
ncbi:Protein phosphatase 2C 7 [Coemansia asiatica]|uniref:Protein phosphatase n=1 Tax=Coemansia asiatica TaxID=1052880 RepID=A0A9W8CI35_9FUNG|nr:Protein phosphatase 2C 7 [Coemansia asiatica]